MTKFTDKQLGQLYYQIARDYKDLSQSTKEIPVIYQQIWNQITWTFQLRDSSLSQIPPGPERDKVYTVLHTFFSALPGYRNMGVDERQKLFSEPAEVKILIQNYPAWHNSCYCGY